MKKLILAILAIAAVGEAVSCMGDTPRPLGKDIFGRRIFTQRQIRMVGPQNRASMFKHNYITPSESRDPKPEFRHLTAAALSCDKHPGQMQAYHILTHGTPYAKMLLNQHYKKSGRAGLAEDGPNRNLERSAAFVAQRADFKKKLLKEGGQLKPHARARAETSKRTPEERTGRFSSDEERKKTQKIKYHNSLAYLFGGSTELETNRDL